MEMRLGDVSVGAVGTAIVAALISLLGLIISKEQKTSEFRQAWVDALRSEITAYLSSLNAIADAARVSYANHAEKVKALAPHYTRINESAFSIALRVNPTEARSKVLIQAMREFNELATDDKNLVPQKIRPIEGRLLIAAQDLLKFEWRRVKRGEPTFLAAKLISLLLVLSTVVAGGILLSRPNQRQVTNAARTAVPKESNPQRLQVGPPQVKAKAAGSPPARG